MKNISYTLLILVTTTFIACDKDDEVSTNAEFSLDIDGLEDLGDDYRYEGWLIVNGAPITTGLFTVDASGALSETRFAVNRTFRCLRR